MRDKIAAIEKAARVMMPGEPCDNCACEACNEDRVLLDAINAALSACDDVCAWKRENAHNGLVHPGCDPTHWPYSGQHGFTYCPHCGLKIKEQP
jgi:hypothetical protein